MTDPRAKSPFVLPDYPYKNAFTAEQVREAMDRKDRILALLMDPVGPDGCLMSLPIDMMHILAFHLAYAGADTHTDSRRLIESRMVRDDSQMFEVYEWRPVGGFGDEPEPEPKRELSAQERAALTEAMVDELTKGLR